MNDHLGMPSVSLSTASDELMAPPAGAAAALSAAPPCFSAAGAQPARPAAAAPAAPTAPNFRKSRRENPLFILSSLFRVPSPRLQQGQPADGPRPSAQAGRQPSGPHGPCGPPGNLHGSPSVRQAARTVLAGPQDGTTRTRIPHPRAFPPVACVRSLADPCIIRPPPRPPEAVLRCVCATVFHPPPKKRRKERPERGLRRWPCYGKFAEAVPDGGGFGRQPRRQPHATKTSRCRPSSSLASKKSAGTRNTDSIRPLISATEVNVVEEAASPSRCR